MHNLIKIQMINSLTSPMLKKLILSLLFSTILASCAHYPQTSPANQPYLDAKKRVQSLAPNEYLILEDQTIFFPIDQPLNIHIDNARNLNAKGTLISPDGSIYHGTVLQGKATGFGKSYKSTGEYYEGEHHEGKFNGEGRLRLSDGSLFIGTFKNDKAYRGEIHFVDGTIAELK